MSRGKCAICFKFGRLSFIIEKTFVTKMEKRLWNIVSYRLAVLPFFFTFCFLICVNTGHTSGVYAKVFWRTSCSWNSVRFFWLCDCVYSKSPWYGKSCLERRAASSFSYRHWFCCIQRVCLYASYNRAVSAQTCHKGCRASSVCGEYICTCSEF